jgi:oligopeptidase B
VLNVPFLDPLTALMDENLPLTHSDHIELGNPLESKEIFDTIEGYSPYHNIGN